MTQARYSYVAILFHWIIVVLLVTNVGLAWYADSLEGAAKIAPLQLHKPIGITILLLTLGRLAWRLMNPPPALSPRLKPWERILARTVHAMFYVLLLAMPLTGWALVSASALITQYPINMFGLFDWPAIAPLFDLPAAERREVHELFEETHHLLAKVIVYGLIPLHVLGALKHQFIDKDNELARMIPFLAREEPRA